MAEQTKTVREAVNEMYAMLAKAAAQRAVDRVVTWGDLDGAEQLAARAAKWLEKSSANAVSWVYDRPRIK